MLENYKLVYICLELLIACLAVAGNILVCWAVFLNSNLQSITNFFLVSLAVADIAVGLLAIPFAITISIGFCANFFGCLFIACFVLILTQSSIFSLLAIAVDRYIAIKNPLRYNSLVTGQRAKAIIALCWVLSVGIGLIPMLGWNRGWNATAVAGGDSCPEGLTECLFEGVVTMDYMVYFNFFGCVLVPLSVMLVIYAHIFMAARHQLRLMGLKVAQVPGPESAAPSSSASRSTLQKEVHAAKSLSIIVGFFAVCWLPVHVINCFHHLCEGCGRLDIWVVNVAIILSHANSVVNPLIYAYRIREFRQTFRRILYQRILRRRDERGPDFGSGDGRSVGGTSIMWTTSPSSKGSSACVTAVNSYILNPNPDRTPAATTQETSRHWTSNSDAAPGDPRPNSPRRKNSDCSATQQRPCVMDCSAQDGIESGSYRGGIADALEAKNNGRFHGFLNVQSLSLKRTDRVPSTELTEVA
ncbi:adenosine receptor A2b-like [Brachionichthys hirsutus]|uniref:adenosine receptor A2b-like n=1 Tax=Brachionichthys hirsutus TaxID=412623 RepID=UPI0036054441